MKDISRDAELSLLYTNHSIRATCITLLDNAGIEARHIMVQSGHKSESSIRSYSKTGLVTKRKMSDLLSSTMTSIPEKKAAVVDFEIEDSFLDSFHISSPCCTTSSYESPDVNKTARQQKLLK